VTEDEARLSRRALLGAAVIVAAGCTARHRSAGADPDAPALAAARAGELVLLSNAAVGTTAYAAHLAHLQALGARPPSPGATPPVAPPGYADAAASVPVLQAAAERTSDGALAAKLASIAASHAVLVSTQR
jgi:hypothetical protein